jgi:hypothetical protein
MTKFIEVVEEGKRVLVNIEKISQVYPGIDDNAVIILNEREGDSVIVTSTKYNEVRTNIRYHCNQGE